jgi:Rod binding domain-containing protein
MTDMNAIPTAQGFHKQAAPDARLRETSEKLEAQFLSEMLKHAGLGETESEFTGGVGEGQFASFLRDLQAEQMVKAGGIGLAETIYQSLKARDP